MRVYDDVGAFFVSILKPSQAWQKAFFGVGRVLVN
jgi:hypothetical protein